MFDGILFDLDGTLWDAVPEITRTWNRALAEFGIGRPPLTVEELRPCMGLELDPIGERLLPGVDYGTRRAVMERCCAMEVEYLAVHGAALYPGEGETLSALAERYPLFVVSNCQDGYIQAFFSGTGLGPLFTDFESAGRTGRPKSENIALVAARHGLKKPIYIGDTSLDYASAQAARVPFLHAAYGFGQVENVPKLRSFPDLPQLLEELGG